MVTNDLGPFFPQHIEFDKPQRTVTEGQQGFLTINMRVERFLGQKGSLKKLFNKK